MSLFHISPSAQFVGNKAKNKAKGWISKQVFQENKAHQIFQKTNISYPLIRTWNTRFEIRPFALLPRLYCNIKIKSIFWKLHKSFMTSLLELLKWWVLNGLKVSSFLSRLTHFLVRYCFDLDSHRWFAKGVVSVANDCNEPNRYRICTDIAKYTYWIIQTILEESVTF